VAVKVATQAHQERQVVLAVAEVVAQEDKEVGLLQLLLLDKETLVVMRQDRQISELVVVAELAQPDHRQQLMQAETVE
jgi:Trp operon repressor